MKNKPYKTARNAERSLQTQLISEPLCRTSISRAVSSSYKIAVFWTIYCTNSCSYTYNCSTSRTPSFKTVAFDWPQAIAASHRFSKCSFLFGIFPLGCFTKLGYNLSNPSYSWSSYIFCGDCKFLHFLWWL